MKIEWKPYGGVAADAAVQDLAEGIVRDARRSGTPGLGHARTGDALVVWSRGEDGTITLTWCLVRHEAQVPR